MLINSELPLCMLDKNYDLNQYDFVLYHLYVNSQTYRDYYLKMRTDHPERFMILDNSAYEFFIKGETLNMNDFVRVINELNPDMYILPDTLMNMEKTLKDTKEFLKMYDITHSEPLAVLQGNTSNELEACALLYQDLGIKNIAIPFHNSFFKTIKDEVYSYSLMTKYGLSKETEDIKYAVGRLTWINNWTSKYYNILSEFKHIHILGSHCPYEKIFYKLPIFKTMDTGYPVKCAIEGYELFKEPNKPDIIIDEFMHDELNENIIELISKNINIFKQL